jgi:YesN/AraC family two-component response regulator
VTAKIRLLVVDDQVMTLRGVRAVLDFSAHIEAIQQAANGREALAIVEETQPDVVLMDARMPVMDGIEATRLIKSRWPKIKVIVYSMYPSYEQDALAAGADRFLLKGSPDESLEDILKEVAIVKKPVINN